MTKPLHFQETSKRYDVFNHKGDYLGEIGYSEKWKCYVWEQKNDVVMSVGCLEFLLTKMKELDREKEKNEM